MSRLIKARNYDSRGDVLLQGSTKDLLDIKINFTTSTSRLILWHRVLNNEMLRDTGVTLCSVIFQIPFPLQRYGSYCTSRQLQSHFPICSRASSNCPKPPDRVNQTPDRLGWMDCSDWTKVCTIIKSKTSSFSPEVKYNIGA